MAQVCWNPAASAVNRAVLGTATGNGLLLEPLPS
jgi:hypothetical protein